jgi:hypothetical protein
MAERTTRRTVARRRSGSITNVDRDAALFRINELELVSLTFASWNLIRNGWQCWTLYDVRRSRCVIVLAAWVCASV